MGISRFWENKSYWLVKIHCFRPPSEHF
jgi:hypothetical protein